MSFLLRHRTIIIIITRWASKRQSHSIEYYDKDTLRHLRHRTTAILLVSEEAKVHSYLWVCNLTTRTQQRCLAFVYHQFAMPQGPTQPLTSYAPRQGGGNTSLAGMAHSKCNATRVNFVVVCLLCVQAALLDRLQMETAAAGIARTTPSRPSAVPAEIVKGTHFMWTMSHAVSHLGTHPDALCQQPRQLACLLVCRTAWEPLHEPMQCQSPCACICLVMSPPFS
jgi:hypothetical protein